jgi:DNA-binding transcriptional ArsR family regulator
MTVAVFEDRPETTRGRWLHQALLAVHAHIRRELASVEQLARAVLDGLAAEELHEELAALKSNTTLWQFQVSCLRYCHLVHLHHNAEDREFFDELEQVNPAIRQVVDRLRADHRAVSDYIDAVEATTKALTEDDSDNARRAVANALEGLKEHLLAHLDYEERTVAATARRLPDLPFSNQLPDVPGSDPTDTDPTQGDHQ